MNAIYIAAGLIVGGVILMIIGIRLIVGSRKPSKERAASELAEEIANLVPVFVDVELGEGKVVIFGTDRDGKFGVGISPASTPGMIGEDAEHELPLQGGFILWFRDKNRRDMMQMVLLGRKE